jgi:hypothetical protein
VASPHPGQTRETGVLFRPASRAPCPSDRLRPVSACAVGAGRNGRSAGRAKSRSRRGSCAPGMSSTLSTHTAGIPHKLPRLRPRGSRREAPRPVCALARACHSRAPGSPVAVWRLMGAAFGLAPELERPYWRDHEGERLSFQEVVSELAGGNAAAAADRTSRPSAAWRAPPPVPGCARRARRPAGSRWPPDGVARRSPASGRAIPGSPSCKRPQEEQTRGADRAWRGAPRSERWERGAALRVPPEANMPRDSGGRRPFFCAAMRSAYTPSLLAMNDLRRARSDWFGPYGDELPREETR